MTLSYDICSFAYDYGKGDCSLGAQTKLYFRVPLSATKSQIAKAVEELFKVKVTAVNHAAREGEDEGISWPGVFSKRYQESYCDSRRGPPDRRNNGTIGAGNWH